MYQHIRITDFKPTASDAVAVAMLDKQKSLPAGYAALDEELGGAISQALARPEFSAGRGSVTTLYPAQGAARLYVIGLGDGARLSEAVRIAAGKLVAAADSARVHKLRIAFEPAIQEHKDFNAEAIGAAIGEGLVIGTFEFKKYKGTAGNGNGKGDAGKPKVAELVAAVDGALLTAAQRGVIVGQSQNLTRALAATPPNVANPSYMADFCRKFAREVGLSCTVIDGKQAKKMGMGGLTAVGQGGSTPPCLIVLEWKGRNVLSPESRVLSRKAKGSKGSRLRTQDSGPVLLVGKAITFDTGGYSLKPTDSMTTMKYDKCGGSAVIGAMHAIAKLKVPQHVVGVIAAAENMIDREAYRVQDIIEFYNGVTCEVTNTDAEGRLVLADALSYGCEKYKPRAVIDLATLTGGVVVALGSVCAGAFVNDTSLREHLFDAAEHTDERLWHLPMWDEYKDLMKGHHSDIVNSGIREASPIQGAIFLSYFVAKDGDFKTKAPVPWAHIDIAGMADRKSDGPLYQKGPTGYGVRLLVRAVQTWR